MGAGDGMTGPSTHALEMLLRLRFAEALLAAAEAEDIVRENANAEAMVAAIADREEMG